MHFLVTFWKQLFYLLGQGLEGEETPFSKSGSMVICIATRFLEDKTQSDVIILDYSE